MSVSAAAGSNDMPLDEYHESFNDRNGDTVLKSADGIKFRTYAVILRLSSPCFRTMLELPKAIEGDAPTPHNVLPLDEKAAVIAIALPLVSGKAFPPDIVSVCLLSSQLSHTCSCKATVR